MSENNQVRKLTVHPDILYSIIQRQAGSLSKALLEAVMNSVDAGATKCKITLDKETFQVKDDGKGFLSREEIYDFFETFGTPHQEGDARYGQYRMGRGQLFAFGHNTWQTGQFKMVVDIKGKGLDYELVTNLKPFKGCQIDAKLYKPLSSWEIQDCISEFKKMVAYVDIPVFLNNVKISKSPTESKWDLETDDAYVKLSNGSNYLQVYNLGVWVTDIYSGRLGTGGIVVSKNQLKVNFARNDILVNECDVWARIRERIRETAGRKVVRKATLTDGERDFIVREFIRRGSIPGTSMTAQEWNEMQAAKVIPTAAGRNQSLLSLFKANELVYVSKENLRMGERLHKAHAFFGITEETLCRFEVGSVNEFLDVLTQSIPEYYRHRLNVTIRDFSEYDSSALSGFETLVVSEAKPELQIAFNAMSVVHNVAFLKLSKCWDHDIPLRKLYLGKSSSALAWTNGVDSIHVEERFLKSCAKNGAAGWHRLAMVLIHEYCHGMPDITGHAHDHAFYEMFEAIATHPDCVAMDFAINAMQRFNNQCVTKGITLSRKMLKKSSMADDIPSDAFDEELASAEAEFKGGDAVSTKIRLKSASETVVTKTERKVVARTKKQQSVSDEQQLDMFDN